MTAAVTGAPGVEVDADGDAGPTYRLTGNVSRGTVVTLTAPLPEGLDTLTAVRFTGLPVDPETALKDTEWGFVVSHVAAELLPPDGAPVPLRFTEVLGDDPDPPFDPKASLNAKSGRGVGAYTKMRRPRAGAFVLGRAAAVPAGSSLKLTLKFDVFEVGAFPLVAKRGRIAVSGDPRFQGLWNDPGRQGEWRELGRLRAERKTIPSVAVPVMRPLEERLARPTHRFDRGNMLDKAEEVSPACRACCRGRTGRSATASPSPAG